MLFEEDEEEVKVTKQPAKTTKNSHSNNKRYVITVSFIMHSVGNTRPGKREFDRHSGTGRGQELVI